LDLGTKLSCREKLKYFSLQRKFACAAVIGSRLWFVFRTFGVLQHLMPEKRQSNCLRMIPDDA